MKHHIKNIHEGIKAFKCDMCNLKFGSKPNLQKHIEVNHTERSRVPCDLCHETFTEKSYLKTHKTLIHDKNALRFVCENCHDTFATISSKRRQLANNVCSKKETILSD